MREEICQGLKSKLLPLNKNDLTYQARKEYLGGNFRKMEEDLDAVYSFEQSLKKGRKKKNSRHRSKKYLMMWTLEKQK